MRIVGFNFTKISVEKPDTQKSVDKVDIETNMDIVSLEEIKDHPLKTEDKAIGVTFSYIVNYKPEFAKVEIKGRTAIIVDDKTAKLILEKWEKKEVLEEFQLFLFNVVLKKSTLKALQLEEELNLPLHIPMPSFRTKSDK